MLEAAISQTTSYCTGGQVKSLLLICPLWQLMSSPRKAILPQGHTQVYVALPTLAKRQAAMGRVGL